MFRPPGQAASYNPAIEIHWLGSTPHDAPVGGKVMALAALAPRHPVPPGFAVVGAGGRASEGRLVGAAYRQLGQLLGSRRPAVAVRSSALGEDSHSASFAGVHETYLNVVGIAEVMSAIARCRKSAGSARAAAYRNQRGLGAEAPAITVLVQAFVAADASGVAFSADPVTGSSDRVIVEAAIGIGESIVSGTVIPDSYALNRSDLALVSRRISEKTVMTVAFDQGVREVAVPTELRHTPALRDEEVIEVARLAIELEAESGHPVDIEFAFRDDRLALLQCRPITTL